MNANLHADLGRVLTAGRTVTGQLLVVDSGERMAGGIAPDDG